MNDLDFSTKYLPVSALMFRGVYLMILKQLSRVKIIYVSHLKYIKVNTLST